MYMEGLQRGEENEQCCSKECVHTLSVRERSDLVSSLTVSNNWENNPPKRALHHLNSPRSAAAVVGKQ